MIRKAFDEAEVLWKASCEYGIGLKPWPMGDVGVVSLQRGCDGICLFLCLALGGS